MSGEYQALEPVEVLPPETGDYGMKDVQNLRFVSDTDGVRVSVYYGKTEEDFSFATERRVARVVTRAGQVYEFKAFLGETVPYYRVVAEKGNYVGAWDVMANMRDASELSYIDTRTKG